MAFLFRFVSVPSGLGFGLDTGPGYVFFGLRSVVVSALDTGPVGVYLLVGIGPPVVVSALDIGPARVVFFFL